MLRIFTVCLMLAACKEGNFRTEVFGDGTRPLGVSTSPVSLTPGTTGAVLTFDAAVQSGANLSVASHSFYGASALSVVPVPVTATAAAGLVAAYQALDHWQVQFTFDVGDTTVFNPDQTTPDRIYYEFTVNDGVRDIPVGGYVLVWAATAAAAGWQAATVSWTAPAAAAGLTNERETDLTGTISKTIDEDLRVGWLVPNGSVKNRRDISTKWKPEGSGAFTLVLRVQGKKSQTLAVLFRDVIVN